MSMSNEAVIGYGMSADKFFKLTGISYQDIDNEYYVFVPYDGAEDDEVMVGYLIDIVDGLGWECLHIGGLNNSLDYFMSKSTAKFRSKAHMFIGCKRL